MQAWPFSAATLSQAAHSLAAQSQAGASTCALSAFSDELAKAAGAANTERTRSNEQNNFIISSFGLMGS